MKKIKETLAERKERLMFDLRTRVRKDKKKYNRKKVLDDERY